MSSIRLVGDDRRSHQPLHRNFGFAGLMLFAPAPAPALLLALLAGPALAAPTPQAAAAPQAAAPGTAPAAEAAAEPLPNGEAPLPEAEAIQTRLEAVEADTSLAPEVQERLIDLYNRTLRSLDQLAAASAQLPTLEEAERTAPQRLAQVKRALANPVEVPQSEVDSGSSLEQIRAARQATDTALEELRQQLEAAQTEIRTRREQAPQLRQKLAELQATIESLREEADVVAEGVDPKVAEAARTARRTALAAAQAELAVTRQQLQTQEVETEWLPLHAQQLEREVAVTEARLRRLTELLAAQRQQQILEMIRQFEAVYAAASPELQETVAPIRELVQRWPAMLRAASRGEKQLATLRAAAASLQEDLEKTRELVESDLRTGGGLSPSVGFLLQRKRSKLPSASELGAQRGEQQEIIEEVQTTLTRIDAMLDELPPPPIVGDSSTPEDEPELVTVSRQVLGQMNADAEAFMFDTLIWLGVRRDEYAKTVAEYHQLIDEHLLWVRDSAPLSLQDFPRAASDAEWLFEPRNLAELGTAFRLILFSRPLVLLVWLGCWIGLLALGPRLRRRIAALGVAASSRTTAGMRPTLETILLTGLLSLPPAIVLGLLGWLLESVTVTGESYGAAVAAAFLLVAALAFPLELLRQMGRPKGLMAAHFDWPVSSLASLRSVLRWMLMLGLPLIFLWRILDASDNENLEFSALARLLFTVVMALTAVLLWRVAHPRNGAAALLLMRKPHGWLEKLHWLWHPLLALLPLALALLSLFGYSYSSVQLAYRFYRTVWMVIVVAILAGLATRWMRISRRRLAIEQMRQRADQREQAGPSEAAPIDVVDADTLDLSEVNQQTQRLVDAGLFVAVIGGLFIIWSPVFPALGFLDRVTLWERVAEDGSLIEAVTLSNLLVAIPILALTVVLVRNAPGLLETAILQRLPLENAARYAITTLSSYLLAALGIIAAADSLGVHWENVQWLVAGLGVGLGFGLQEIFANFISGIILLFEQPIRVGDIVTVDGTSGVISRIRIRATTITNWDRQEYVVPNKDLITGRLINWTLSDSTNRVQIQVGIAYGSDTRKACKILEEICHDHPAVSKQIAPIITFEGFGDSSLNLVVRCFLTSLEARLQIIHELHTAIHDRFKEEGIEIPFPQRDLHIHGWPPP
ncbi:mechanosensitive ion channel domain-containing protein [Candidatus Laterigemmans baculatus]|uniref:mechanosensitive ion channel domain-containing protein n=1 Tax=Candidatus Laterigemmans baculatus TaxID=2770505 RepID=UPI0013DCCD7B|nr:mechanosensitive ion channel domain-containing protein [Candidatus Laterigemmans baculatus]